MVARKRGGDMERAFGYIGLRGAGKRGLTIQLSTIGDRRENVPLTTAEGGVA